MQTAFEAAGRSGISDWWIFNAGPRPECRMLKPRRLEPLWRQQVIEAMTAPRGSKAIP